MRLLAHLSDIHFGRTDPAVVAGVLAHLHQVQPAVCVVSGDLTQRAKVAEFEAARAFLHELPGKVLVVPGNHDVPLWNLFRRFLQPLTRYGRYISPEPMPVLHDEVASIVGINTARSFTHKNGRINRQQAQAAAEILRGFSASGFKIVVTHHPFDPGPTYHRRDLVGRGSMALQVLGQAGADILLAGHLHDAYTGGTAQRYPLAGYSALVVQAGTATSTRLRGSANSFNLLHLAPPVAEVEVLSWDASAGTFCTLRRHRYEKRAGVGFVPLDASTIPA